VSDESGQWILYELSFIRQEGTSDIGPERMLTLIMNRHVLNRTWTIAAKKKEKGACE
jgi:hypothetical protein